MKNIIITLLFILPWQLLAQTPGQIFQDAPNDANDILDPNNDGYISDDGAAFSTAENFEYPFIAIHK